MAKSLLKLDTELKETCRERDKALQELARLKQHLLEKVQYHVNVYFIAVHAYTTQAV